MSRQRVRTSYTNSRQQAGTSAADHRQRTYIDGNTVRKLEALPEKERREQKEKKRRADRATKANRARALQMNAGYLLFLTLAVAVSVGVCVAYIQLQSDVNKRMKSIATLESQVLDLKADNDAAQKRIETSVNMEDIRNAAMNELGMVYPGQDQIVYFEVDEEDYMNQYQDIPKN